MEYIIAGLLIVVIALMIMLLKKNNDNEKVDFNESFNGLKDDIGRNITNMGELLAANQREQSLALSDKIAMLDKNLTDGQKRQNEALSDKISVLDKNLVDNQQRQNMVISDKINILDKNLTAGQERQNTALSEKITLLNNSMLEGQQKQNTMLSEKITMLDKNISEKQDISQKTVSQGIIQQEERFKSFSADNAQQLEAIRNTVEKRLTNIQQDNNQQLDSIRKIVDEKLQETIDKKMTQSFELVSQRLEQVYKGLGEMQNLAVSVGDLKNTLSNVKTRGILGEIQLGAILSEILSPEQYAANVKVRKNSDVIVEFAIKMPAGGSDSNEFVYLPIDAKFPCDTYNVLLGAYDSGDKAQVETASKALVNRLKSEAKDISTKYIAPPETTDFAIMFLPVEGLYAEAVRLGMIEELQRKYHVNIAGPSTMAALLNSLQMGFRTLAIQKRSSEVWEVLGAVRTEFDKFEEVLTSTRKRLEMANNDLDKLVGTRTRQIIRRLKNVERLEENKAVELLENSDE